MGLLEDLGDESRFVNKSKRSCSVCDLLLTLKPDESKALKARLDNPRITHSSIVKVLTDNGYRFADSTVGRHRRGICKNVSK